MNELFRARKFLKEGLQYTDDELKDWKPEEITRVYKAVQALANYIRNTVSTPSYGNPDAFKIE